MTQEQALKIMKLGLNVYLSGSAGSGKTYVLNQYINYLKDHDVCVAVTASTGIAATHMHGMTIHGWAGIGVREELTDYDLEQLEQKQYLWKRFEKTKVLIIDEVSMLHAHRLDMVDKVCRRFKRNNIPFGGIQVILSGDFFQLPPINKIKNDEDNRDMIIYSEAWKNMKPAICYLTEQHRQEDALFTELLNMIRANNVSDKFHSHLMSRMDAEIKNTIRPTKLYTHNIDVDSINMSELESLDGKEKFYKMEMKGNPVLVEILKKSCLAHEILRLKIGAEVMFIKNNFERGYVNGTRGIITNFLSDGTPIVRLYNGREIETIPESWSIDEDGKIKAEISQLPLRLAWAITIHKSQGMSLDSAEIDLSKTFVYGMGYVALSRVRTLDGIRLVGFHADSLRVDPKVLSLDEKLQIESEDNEELFGKISISKQKEMERETILKMDGFFPEKGEIKKNKKEKKDTVDETKELLDKKLSLELIAKTRGFTVGTIIGHIDKLIKNGREVYIAHLCPDKKIVDIIADNIVETEGRLIPLKNILEEHGYKVDFDDIKVAKWFVK